MWFGKNIIAKLGLVLAVAVPALAADVKDMFPLKFGNLGEDDQVQYWNDLMSFKMWGTDRINFKKVTLPDKVGALGTGGDFTWDGAGFVLGGPIYVNGDVIIKDGQKFFTSGPARINGDLKLDGDKEQNTMVGTYCVKGEVNALTEHACDRGNAVDANSHCQLNVGEDSYNSGACADVKQIPDKLFIPEYPFSNPVGAENLGDFTVTESNTRVIDIPDIYEEDGVTIKKKMYDYVLNSLTLEQQSKLYIRIGSPQALARFFVNGTIKLNQSSVIQVILVNGKWNSTSKKWEWKEDKDTTHVSQEGYAGNLMFYTTESLSLPAMHGAALLEGTFMSTKTIDIGSNLHLAGQFLAKEISISNDLDGSGFRYVPFNAPVITASGTDNIIEEGRDDNVNIVLDKTPSTDITFEYCYY